MAKINLPNSNKSTCTKLDLISNVIDQYNKILYRYTGDFKGRISLPKLDKIPRKYLSIHEYINSKPEWKNIMKFLSESGIDNVYDYIDIMIRNWNITKANMNLKMNKPTANIIFSLKMTYLYEKYLKMEANKEDMTKHLAIKNNDGFYRLTPNKQSNINSLIRLKKINSELSYHDIVDIFKAEFEIDFINKIKSTPLNEITEETLVSMFTYEK